MFTQFSKISSQITPADKAKGVKRLLFSQQHIEHKISTFDETINKMEERKTIIHSLMKVAHSFKNSLNTVFSPIFRLLEAYCYFISVPLKLGRVKY